MNFSPKVGDWHMKGINSMFHCVESKEYYRFYFLFSSGISVFVTPWRFCRHSSATLLSISYDNNREKSNLKPIEDEGGKARDPRRSDSRIDIRLRERGELPGKIKMRTDVALKRAAMAESKDQWVPISSTNAQTTWAWGLKYTTV